MTYTTYGHDLPRFLVLTSMINAASRCFSLLASLTKNVLTHQNLNVTRIIIIDTSLKWRQRTKFVFSKTVKLMPLCPCAEVTKESETNFERFRINHITRDAYGNSCFFGRKSQKSKSPSQNGRSTENRYGDVRRI